MNIIDVRADMPNYDNYKNSHRRGDVLGIAVHHSATVNRTTGAPVGSAQTIFNYHVNTLEWQHGGYNYIILADGTIEYALDESIAAYHAGFSDPDNAAGLEYGQYWNNHYIAICMIGWFSNHRAYRDADNRLQHIPDNYTTPTDAQRQALLALIAQLRQQHHIPAENVRGHRELAGNATVCPGYNVDMAQLRAEVRQQEQPNPPPTPPKTVPAGEHVLILPDMDRYLTAAMAYIWKFQPDVSVAVGEAVGRWRYVTVVGDRNQVSDSQLSQLRTAGARLVQRVAGDPPTIQNTLDKLVEGNQRFLSTTEAEALPSVAVAQSYTVQPGDTFPLIAQTIYGEGTIWRIIFEANRTTVRTPDELYPGQVLTIPAM